MSDNQPVKKLRDGAISAAIWKNEGGEDNKVFYSVNFERTFTDKSTGEVKSTSGFNRNDLLRLARLANKAYDAIEDLGANG